MKISITRALAELKLLDKRITKETDNLAPATAVVKDELTSDKSQLFKDTADQQLDKVQALIQNAYKVKAAIIQSNATTSVEIGGKTMTVAEAIAKKDLVEYESTLRARINYNIVQHTAAAERSEASVRAKGEQIAAALAGEDKAMFDSVYQSYMDKNTTSLLVSDKIAKANNDIDMAVDEFETEVDFVLSESNTRTTIEVGI
jgi:hypothetical protein